MRFKGKEKYLKFETQKRDPEGRSWFKFFSKRYEDDYLSWLWLKNRLLATLSSSHYIIIFNSFLSIFLNFTSQVVSILIFIQLDHMEDTKRTVLKQTKEAIFGLQFIEWNIFSLNPLEEIR